MLNPCEKTLKDYSRINSMDKIMNVMNALRTNIQERDYDGRIPFMDNINQRILNNTLDQLAELGDRIKHRQKYYKCVEWMDCESEIVYAQGARNNPQNRENIKKRRETNIYIANKNISLIKLV